ncbi:hypothetical protein Sango_0528300 [Sesamum angolense]|uniref:Uncharacterized protein n=1 Tax=Sesamum angolense TaxID=2727404 RepID=A0AAE1X4N2_9LAMI|nr:hypothetical protein Sango_0528300 [Sesamum angolense]
MSPTPTLRIWIANPAVNQILYHDGDYPHDNAKKPELLDLMQAGTLEPEVAFLNASLISESLKRCGISDSTSYILVARFGASSDESDKENNFTVVPQMTVIKGLIKGTEIGLEELAGRADQSQIQKHYKISALELGISSVSDAITCRIAARDAL